MNEQFQRIRFLKDVMGLSFRQVAAQIGMPRKRCAKIYQGDSLECRRSRGSLLDPYYSLIAGWFSEFPHLKAIQVYEWLRERDVKVSYSKVVKYTRKLRKKKEKEVFYPLTFLRGEEAQVDWCFVKQPGIGKLACFVFLLSYSRYLFAHLFPRSQFEFFIEGHLMAFSTFQGTPQGLRYDNLKSVVLARRPEVRYNPRFMEFCRHYGVKILLCNPRKANEKGRVERVIRSMRERFFSTAAHRSLEGLNKGLHEWVERKNHTIHRATGRTPEEMRREEPLRPLPAIPWNNVTVHPPKKTTKTAMMIFDTNYYSVPDYLVGKSLSIHSTPSEVIIYDRTSRVASHPRSFERNKTFVNPLHRNYSRISRAGKLQRIHQVVSKLDPAMAEFLRLNMTCGEDPQQTAYEVFTLLRIESRGILISAARDCLRRKSPRLKTLLSCLQPESSEPAESVHPQNTALLAIDYHPRTLEVYDDDTATP